MSSAKMAAILSRPQSVKNNNHHNHIIISRASSSAGRLKIFFGFSANVEAQHGLHHIISNSQHFYAISTFLKQLLGNFEIWASVRALSALYFQTPCSSVSSNWQQGVIVNMVTSWWRHNDEKLSTLLANASGATAAMVPNRQYQNQWLPSSPTLICIPGYQWVILFDYGDSTHTATGPVTAGPFYIALVIFNCLITSDIDLAGYICRSIG